MLCWSTCCHKLRPQFWVSNLRGSRLKQQAVATHVWRLIHTSSKTGFYYCLGHPGTIRRLERFAIFVSIWGTHKYSLQGWTDQYGTVHNTQRYVDDLYRPCMIVIDGKSGDASPLLKPYQKPHVRTSRCMAEVLTEVPPLSWPLIYDAINISTMNPIYWSYSSTWLTMGYQLVCIPLCYVPCWDIILHQCISICNLYAVCVLMVT